jgi:hypothetical protein
MVGLSIPVFCANVPSVVSWNATAINDNSENHEANASDDLHNTEDELDLFQLARYLKCFR